MSDDDWDDEDETPKAHTSDGEPRPNDTSDTYNITAEELRQFIERAEQLAAEKKDIADQEKEAFAEAKARGYDTKIIRKIIAIRKRERDELAEEKAILLMYGAALGMDEDLL